MAALHHHGRGSSGVAIIPESALARDAVDCRACIRKRNTRGAKRHGQVIIEIGIRGLLHIHTIVVDFKEILGSFGLGNALGCSRPAEKVRFCAFTDEAGSRKEQIIGIIPSKVLNLIE